MASSSRRHRGLRSLLFLVYWVGVTAVGVEVACRIFLPQMLTYDPPGLYEPDDTIGWRRRPGLRTVVRWQGPVDFCTDDEGDRISCEREPRTDCARNVLVIGDSFVDALGVPYEQTVWHRIEQDTGACVHVAGVGGYNPAQYARLLRERLAKPRARFDLVMLNLYAGNDLTPEAGIIPEPRQAQRRHLRLLPRELTFRGIRDWIYPVNQLLESRSHAWVAFRNAFRRVMLEKGVHGAVRRSQLTRDVIALSLEPVRRAAAETRRHGAELLVVLIPVPRQVLDPDASELLREWPELVFDADMDLTTKRVLPRLRRIPGIHVVDLLPGFRAQATSAHWGELDVHFSPEGHALWFALVREEVRELLGLEHDRSTER